MSIHPERELKYCLERRHNLNALHLLENLCEPDPKFQCNIISSIYFDGLDHQFAMEKAASDYLKTKLRVRWYTDPQHPGRVSDCHLEVKNKIGSTRNKSRWSLDCNGKDIEQALHDGSLQKLITRRLEDGHHGLAYLALKPMVLVTYTRHRFIESFSHARIALDTDIHAWPPLVKGRVIHLPQSVLEVKGSSDTLPQCLKPLTCLNIRKEAFSKYYLCFNQLYDYHQ